MKNAQFCNFKSSSASCTDLGESVIGGVGLKHLEAILFPGLVWRYMQVQQMGSLNVDVCKSICAEV